MKGLFLLLSALAALAVTQTAVVKAPPSLWSWGYLGVIGDEEVDSVTLYKTAIDNTVQTEDYTYTGDTNFRINAILVLELGEETQNATPSIVAGGNGTSSVTVRITSSIGNGFNIGIRIWGREYL